MSTFVQCAPGEWSLMLGEALHSMRSSLDHLVYGLAALEQGEPLTEEEARKIEFRSLDRSR